tara:strand:+ start:340 stop:606 length:267 start_codon:yes stop_codon:yes gene_type:complete
MNLILEDIKVKKFQEFNGLTESKKMHIMSNIIKINNETNQAYLTVYEDYDSEGFINKKFEEDNGLYEKLINDFNKDKTELLNHWPNKH